MEGGEQADQHAKGATESGSPSANRREDLMSLAFLKRQRTEKARRQWREDIVRRNQGNKAFCLPPQGTRPQIREGLRRASKGVAARYYKRALTDGPSPKGEVGVG